MFLCKYACVVEQAVADKERLSSLEKDLAEAEKRIESLNSSVASFERALQLIHETDDTYLHQCMLQEKCKMRREVAELQYVDLVKQSSLLQQRLDERLEYLRKEYWAWMRETLAYPRYKLPFSYNQIANSILDLLLQ